MRSILILTLLIHLASGPPPLHAQTRRNDASFLAHDPQSPWPPKGQPLRLPVSRDNWVSAYRGEEPGNNGGAATVKLKGIVELTLLDFDPAPLRGKIVTGGTLHLKPKGDERLLRATLSTIASPWVEGTSRSYRPQQGSSSFAMAGHDQLPWSFPGSDLTSVINGRGQTFWAFDDATAPDERGHQSLRIHPLVLAARIAGVSQGLALTDDVGHEWEGSADHPFVWREFPNRFFHSREAPAADAPYFTLYVAGEDHHAPAAVREIASDPADLPAGEAYVSWLAPEDPDVVGFFVRYRQGHDLRWDTATELPRHLIPLARGPGERVTLHLRDLPASGDAGAQGPPESLTLSVRTVDGAGNLGPEASARITLSQRQPMADLPTAAPELFAQPAELPELLRARIAVIDALDKVVPVDGRIIPERPAAYLAANHLWSAKDRIVRLHAARNEFVSFTVRVAGPIDKLRAQVSFDHSSLRGSVLALRSVQSPLGPMPDPLAPLDPGLTVAEERFGSMLVSVYVPHDAPPGPTPGLLMLSVGDQWLPIKLEVRVWNWTLPDKLSFVPQMNAYGLPGSAGSALERAYYRLAHVHRTCLNRLPYNWRGQVIEGYRVPDDEGRWDFARFDAAYGPLLDGSAFADLPRAGRPVDAFYLPLNDNWPVPNEPHYRGGYWADQAMSQEYWQSFSDACERWARHLRQRGDANTTFEFFLNSKVFFRKQDWSRSSAYWIFDEPVNTQDFWALRQFGIAFKRGVDRAMLDLPAQQRWPRLAYRCDISRPQWQRDLLDGVMDVNVVGGAGYDHPRLMEDRVRLWHESVLVYGSSNPVTASNVQPAAWCVDAWARGFDGVVPWQTVGSDASWKEADQNAMFYPASTAPLPSVRLKAYQRGQQDVEYLAALAAARNLPRHVVGAWARETLKLKVRNVHAADVAGAVDFAALDAVELWRLRTRVGAFLDAQAGEPIIPP